MTTTERQPLKYQACANGVSCLADLYECQVYEVERILRVEMKEYDNEKKELVTFYVPIEVRCLVAAFDEDHATAWFHSLDNEEAEECAERPKKRV